MARRFRTSRRGSARKRDLVWVNIPFSNQAFTETVGNTVLMVPEDWEGQFSGNSFERATLMAIRGDIVFQQTVVATSGNNGFFGLYIADANATVVPQFTVAGMAEVDWLHVGAFGAAATLVTATSAFQGRTPIDVKTKRRLSSQMNINLAIQYAADAAAPAGVVGGLLRFLVARA